jgi:hypothetical protein
MGRAFLGGGLEHPADGLAYWGADYLADSTGRPLDEIAEEIVELLLVGNFQELRGQFHQLRFAEYFAALAGPFGLAELELFFFESLRFRVEFQCAFGLIHGSLLNGFGFLKASKP